MTRWPLSGPDLYDWIALRRVNDSGVTRLGEWWLDRSHRVPGYVTDALAELCRRKLVALGDPDPVAGCMARAVLTTAGTVRYEQLCRQRETALQVSALQFCASGAWLPADGPGLIGMRLVTPAEPKCSRSAPRRSTPAGLRVPDPQFPTKTRLAAGRAVPHRRRLLAASRIPVPGSRGRPPSNCDGCVTPMTRACTC